MQADQTQSPPGARRAAYAGTLLAVAVVYFVLAKLGLRLASINPSASPIWPPTGFALAAVLLCGTASGRRFSWAPSPPMPPPPGTLETSPSSRSATRWKAWSAAI